MGKRTKYERGTYSRGSERELAASDLRCEHLTNPLGLDVARPTFGWAPIGRPQLQVAFQVLVASDPDVLSRGTGDQWDSGKVVSEHVSGIIYRGTPLGSRRRYWWTVRLWGESGTPGPFAVPANFEMGLLERSDWQGRWIAAGAGISAPLLRTEFTVPGAVRRARAYVTALGYYELQMNGARIDDRRLDPATTNYDRDPDLVDGEGMPAQPAGARVLYATYDVTDCITAGRNAVGLLLGHGWYSAEADIGEGPVPRTPWGDRPRALLQIEIETDKDESLLVVTDDRWQVASGPILYNDYGHGESYDARRELPGWSVAGFDSPGWQPVTLVDPPAATLRAEQLPPQRVVETRSPERTHTSEGGALIVDFGQHFSGWTRIRVSGPTGASVVLRHAGELDSAGELDDDANKNAWQPARQTDTYILRGDTRESWEPRFTLHGFRYVEVTTSDPRVSVHEVEGRVVHSALPRTGDFHCGDPLLNRIHQNVLWTLRSSFHGYPQDAAERYERVGWVGDTMMLEDSLYHFDACQFWLKWLDDLADAQLPDGRFPMICPIHWRGKLSNEPSEVPGTPEGYDAPEGHPEVTYLPYAAAIDLAMTSHPQIAWHLYQYYGDTSVLLRHYQSMRRGVEFMRSRADGLIITEGWGDHMEPQLDGTSSLFPQRTPVELTRGEAAATSCGRGAALLLRWVNWRGYQGMGHGCRGATAPVRPGNDLQQVAVRVVKVEAAAVVPCVDLIALTAPRVGPVRKAPFTNSLENLVELYLAY